MEILQKVPGHEKADAIVRRASQYPSVRDRLTESDLGDFVTQLFCQRIGLLD